MLFFVILLICLDRTVSSTNSNDNFIRFTNLTNCEAFILYSVHCGRFFDTEICEFVGSESDNSEICKNLNVETSDLLEYRCCPGFKGCDFDEECPVNTFGVGCHGKCQCQNGAECSKEDGSCTCPIGWTGQFCERTCPDGFYGDGCFKTCPECKNNSYCNHVNGQCMCAPNFSGELCDEECDIIVCPEFCHVCPNDCGLDDNSTCCDYVGGFCLCGPGWKGHYCTEPCDEGKFGQYCENDCKCLNNATCFHVNGNCLCPPGWMGTLCNEQCEQGYYGYQCLEKCNCPNNSSCDHVTGACKCHGDWQGYRCNEVSHCKPHQSCQPANGTCIVKVEDTFNRTTPSLKVVGLAAVACITTFLLLVVFTRYYIKRNRIQSRSFTIERKLPLFSNGPKPPPRPAITTFNNEPVYDSIGEGEHYLEIIDNKPSGIYNPEYLLSGGGDYMIPSKILIPSDKHHSSSDESAYSSDNQQNSEEASTHSTLGSS